MSLASGTRLGVYEVVALAGSGGMGEVYRCRDTRLNRFVAIKVLLQELPADASRRERFEREARAIAALSHPSICTLHDVGTHGDTAYMVMELLEGETLAARIARGALPVREVIAYGVQIADALDCAHRAGVVHRDLKPGNVMITNSGIKVLDFGLAKHAQLPATDDATAAGTLTRQGEILGTWPYMAPEQLEGRPVDARADVFAFGALLYEMITGRRAFEGTNTASVIGSVLRSQPPPVSQVRPGIPRALERIVEVCLAKDPAGRWSSAHDVSLQLQGLLDEPAAITAPRASGRRSTIAWIVAGVATLAALVAGWLATQDRSQPALPTDVLSIVAPPETWFVRGEAPQLSPDGRHVAFIARDRSGSQGLYIRSRDSAAARLLPYTVDASQPFWSPDSSAVGFFAENQLKTVPLNGGPSTVLARVAVPRGAAWSRDNLILFSPRPNVPLSYVKATGGEPTPVPSSDPNRIGIPGFPVFLPDGRHYLHLELDLKTRYPAYLALGSLDSPGLRNLMPVNSNGIYASGHILFRRGTALMAQPFDPDKLELTGAAVVVAENVGYNPISYQLLFSASQTGAIAYRDAMSGSQLMWFDRSGAQLSAVAPRGEINTFCMTGDGKRIAYDAADVTGSVDIWTHNLETVSTTRLTMGGPPEFYPVCSVRGAEVLFAALAGGPPNIYRQSLDAPGQYQPVLTSPLPKLPSEWTADGTLLFAVLKPETNWDIETIPITGGTPSPLLNGKSDERTPTMSPDGRWLAYSSNESGRYEIYVQPVPLTGARWLISNGGGGQPRWSADGRLLYYIAPDRSLMTVTIHSTSGVFTAASPTRLMATTITQWEANAGWSYVVSQDGKRILMSAAEDENRPISLILNWPSALKH